MGMCVWGTQLNATPSPCLREIVVGMGTRYQAQEWLSSINIRLSSILITLVNIFKVKLRSK